MFVDSIIIITLLSEQKKSSIQMEKMGRGFMNHKKK